MRISQLMNDMNNIRETQKSYGMPPIGDLFRARPSDIEETVQSIYSLVR
jgi:hypothetical protein